MNTYMYLFVSVGEYVCVQCEVCKRGGLGVVVEVSAGCIEVTLNERRPHGRCVYLDVGVLGGDYLSMCVCVSVYRLADGARIGGISLAYRQK